MLLAQPVSRIQVLWSQAVVTIVGLAVLATVSWCGIYTGIMTTSIEETVRSSWTIPWLGLDLPNPLAQDEIRHLPMLSKVDPAWFVPASFNLFALGFFLAGLATLLSSFDRYRWRTIGLVVGFYIFQIIVKVIGLGSESLTWLKRCSFFVAYEPERFVSIAINEPHSTWNLVTRNEVGAVIDLGPLGYNAILLGVGIVSYLAATVLFQRRDLPAPL
jgi:ABC-2 type transport system permease protein